MKKLYTKLDLAIVNNGRTHILTNIRKLGFPLFAIVMTDENDRTTVRTFNCEEIAIIEYNKAINA